MFSSPLAQGHDGISMSGNWEGKMVKDKKKIEENRTLLLVGR
jgi:hypothetical protein